MYYNDEQHITFGYTLTHAHTQWKYFVTTNNDYYRDRTSLYNGNFHDEHDGLNHNHSTVNKQNKTIIIPFTEKL